LERPTNDVPPQTLVLPPSAVGELSALLQRGVAIPARTECSVQSFLVEQLGIDPGYVKARITTVFLDGKVVDALDAVNVHDGSLLALSAALPGLVGATLRMGGAYSAMRSAISRAADAPGASPATGARGLVRVKLFNLLIGELGPVLLRHGILLEPSELPGALAAGCAGGEALRPGAPVLLRVSLPGVPT
jgi:hypothetical protein